MLVIKAGMEDIIICFIETPILNIKSLNNITLLFHINVIKNLIAWYL